jgi:hypothetical protein
MKSSRSLKGDGRDELIVTSRGAIGVLGFQADAFAIQLFGAGTRIGSWALNPSSDTYTLSGDIDGDGTAEVFATSAGGIGFLKFGPNGVVSCPYQITNGQTWGGWRFDTSNNEFGPLVDMDADGRAELLVTSPWGLAVLAAATTGFLTPVCAANGTVFGDWTVDTTDDAFGPAGDFDGDGRAEVVMVNSQGLRLLRLGEGTLDTVAFLANGASLSGWSFDTTAISIAGVGDFDGDGKAELLLLGPSAMYLLSLENGAFTCIASTAFGGWIGGWRLGGQDRWGPVADFDGDGKVEIVVSSGWGIGLVSFDGGALDTRFAVANGTSLGGWRLDTARDRLNIPADLDGDGKAELFVTSPWGVGMLDLSGPAPTSKAMAQGGTAIGGWSLDMNRNDFEQGRGRGLILYDVHNIPGTVAALQARGYVVVASDQHALLQRTIRRFAVGLGIGDRLFVHFWTDGGQTSRTYGETDNAPCGQHYLQTDDGGLELGDFLPYFSRAAWSGVDITVIDSSCHGGETVVAALGERYCAMSMTGVFEVAQLHTPDPQGVIMSQARPGNFGAWYSGPHNAFSLWNGTLLRNSIIDRIQQRVYRNDNVPTTMITMLGRDALRSTDYASPWYVTAAGCYLSKYVDPGNYNSSCTNSAQAFISGVNAAFNPQYPAIQAYKTHVFQHPQAAAAASLFSTNFAIIWQTMSGDLGWNPVTSPGEYTAAMNGVDPSRYNSSSGFEILINDAVLLESQIEANFGSVINLLGDIDAAVKAAAQQKQLVMPTIADKPISFRVSADLRLLHSLDRVALNKPAPADTGSSQVDALVSEYQLVCSGYSTACNKVTIMLAIIEDCLTAVESANRVNAADYVLY